MCFNLSIHFVNLIKVDDTIFCPPLICMLVHFLTAGPWEHLDQRGSTLFGHQSTQSAIFNKNDQNTLGDQNISKPHHNKNFHVFTSKSRLVNIFINFDQI